jgi:formylmethanofuran dehydrogenase subunit E
MKLKQIGVIHSPYKTIEDVPRATLIEKETCKLEIFSEFEDALLDIEQASHIIIFYWMDKADRTKLQGITPIDKKKHGVFATRAPHRPNPIGFSVVRLLKKNGTVLSVGDITALDGTPLIDIKPYVAKTDLIVGTSLEWIDKIKEWK